jgi:putative phosphoesterase
VSLAFLEELRAYGAPVHAVHGNRDEPALRALLPATLEVELEGLRVGLDHDGGTGDGRHERLRRLFPGCDAVAYGHSHLPEVDRSSGVWILNPGSPTERRRAPARTMIALRDGAPELVVVGA